MRKELQEKLYKDFKNIFKEKDGKISETCMCWGIECGDGWFDIIYDLCTEIRKIEQKYKVNIIATQVKEKFGSLRFYTREIQSKKTKEYQIFLSLAKKVAHIRSLETCELCGKKASLRDRDAYIQTLCDKCYK